MKQVLFKSRLRSVLYGVREADASLFSFTESPLAQWVGLTLKPAYGTRPEVAGIERLLRQTFDAGQDLVRQYQRGELEQARQGMERIERFATEIDILLTSLEKASATVLA